MNFIINIIKKISLYILFISLIVISLLYIETAKRLAVAEDIIQSKERTIKRYENFIISYGIATIDTSEGYPQLLANKKVLRIIRSYWDNSNNNKK